MAQIELSSLVGLTQSYIAKNYATALIDKSKTAELKAYIGKCLYDTGYSVAGYDTKGLVERLFTEMAEYSILTKHLADPDLEEININGWDDVALTHLDGRIEKAEEHFFSPQHAIDVVKKLLHHSGMIIDNAAPIAQGHLPNNTRITALKEPIVDADRGIAVSIRMLHPQRVDRENLIDTDSLTDDMLAFLETCLRYGVSFVVAGRTSSGKTTLLNSLLGSIPDSKRIYTIESGARELSLVKRDEQGRVINNKVGRWGVKETRKNIQKWRNRPRKPKPNPNLKQLPSPQRPMLEAPKKGIKTASKAPKNTVKGTKTAAKGAKTTAKATVKGTKAAAKGAVKAAQLIKKAAIATAKFVKVAVKAIIAAAKAVVAAVKGIIAAIVAGGWVAVLIIVIIVIVACIVGSVYAIFVPAEDSEITIYSVTRDLEREHHEKENELAATVYYDVLNYEGSLAGWEEVIAVYAVKLNLDSDDPQEVATFDESKAEALRVVFLDMNELSLMSETHTSYVTRQETDANGNVVEVTEEINTVYVTVITTPKSAAQIAEEYGFTAQQKQMLTELLSSENAELWAGILGE